MSSSVANVRYMSRWRVSTGRSVGSSGPPPSWWMHVERADQPDVVDEVGEVARPPAAIEVAHERRPADGAEDEVRAAEARRRAPGSGRAAGTRAAPVATSASTWAGSRRTIRVARSTRRPGRRERIERPVAQDLHPDLGEDPQRRDVDRLDLVRGQDLDRAERVDQPPPRQLADPGAPRDAVDGAGLGVGARGDGHARLIGYARSRGRRFSRPSQRPRLLMATVGGAAGDTDATQDRELGKGST